MPNENDNKLVNLADLKAAFDDIDDRKKDIQTAVSDPTASGTSLSFIDSISQNAQGIITPTKKNVPNATQSASGLMSAEDKIKLDTRIVADSTARSLANGTSSAYNVTGLTSKHIVACWQFSGGYAENSPPGDITITTSDGSYTITVTNLSASGITIKPIFIET